MFKDDITSVITNINKFMLTNDFFETKDCINYKNTSNNKQHLPKENSIVNDNYKGIDTLFCCFYTIFNECFHEQPKNKIQEQQIKISIGEKIDSKKDLIKECKLSTITYLKDNLVNDSKISLTTFFTLCYINNYNVIWVCKNVGYKMKRNDNPNFFFVEQNKSLFKLQDSHNGIMNDLFWIDSIKKPLKSISSYKVDEIKEILKIVCSNKLTSTKKNKKEYYEDLVQYFSCLSIES